jgi:hypothetical protein
MAIIGVFLKNIYIFILYLTLMFKKGFFMKNSIISNMQKAKESHLSQLNCARLLVKGLDLDEKALDTNQYDCAFGVWLFDEGAKLKPHCEEKLIEEIEALHASWHEEYRKIHKIYFSKKAGFFTKFIGKEVEISPMERDKALSYVSDLEKITAEIVKKIDLIVRKVGALGITNLK